MSENDKPLTIGLLLIDGFSMMSYASLIEPFRAANVLTARRLFAWTHISTGADRVVSSGETAILADETIASRPDCDMLFVLAAGDPANFRDRRVFAWLRQLDRAGMAVGGVSGGPYLLARAGLLAGHRATIHWEHAPALQEEYPELALEPSLYVIDRKRMSCAGGTAAFDLTLAIIAERHGEALARQVGEWFIHTGPRHADIGQRPGRAQALSTAPPALRRMLTQMEANIEEPLERANLARLSGLSLRQLERQSQRVLGMGIAEVYMQVRLERAAELLRSTNLALTEVAMACGFRTVSHFSRRFRERFGHSPGQVHERRRFMGRVLPTADKLSLD